MGLCAPLEATGRSCDYEDDTEECRAARAHNRPCVFSLDNIIRMMKKGEDEDARARPAVKRTERRTWHCLPSWIPGYQKCTSKTEVVEEAEEMPYQRLLRPEWVPADQPTEHRGIGGVWMKLRLEVAEAEALPPSRPTFRPRVSAASGPSVRLFPEFRCPVRILAAIEGHVRTLAAAPASLKPWLTKAMAGIGRF